MPFCPIPMHCKNPKHLANLEITLRNFPNRKKEADCYQAKTAMSKTESTAALARNTHFHPAIRGARNSMCLSRRYTLSKNVKTADKNNAASTSLGSSQRHVIRQLI